MIVPVAQTGNAAIIIPRVQDYQIRQIPQGKRSPDAQVIVQIYLADRHPFEIRSYRIHFSSIDTDAAAIGEKRSFRVVQSGKPIAVSIVGYFVVVPCRDPRRILRELK